MAEFQFLPLEFANEELDKLRETIAKRVAQHHRDLWEKLKVEDRPRRLRMTIGEKLNKNN